MFKPHGEASDERMTKVGIPETYTDNIPLADTRRKRLNDLSNARIE